MELFSLKEITELKIYRNLFLFFLVNVLLLGSVAYADSDLIISGVIDGPLGGGNPKAIEVYVINDVADLSIYGLGVANNGGGTDGQEFTFPAVGATEGDYLYIASESVEFNNYFGFLPGYTDNVALLNGDDAIELFKNGVVEDLFGDVAVDGTGQPWEYLDGWVYRISGSTPSAVFNIADWSFSGINALDGETTNATAATPIPISTFFSPSTTPTSGTPIPTLSEWMLFLLMLLLSFFGVRMSGKRNAVSRIP